jgi:AP-2 complex subunit alpha
VDSFKYSAIIPKSSRSNFAQLVQSSTRSGILYENEKIQVGIFPHTLNYIGIKSEYQQQLGRIGLYFGNKTNSDLTDFSIVCLDESPDLKIAVVQELGSIIPAKQQDVVMFNIECIGAFSAIPRLSLSFAFDTIPSSHILRLPVIALKFIEPVALSTNDFTSRWNQIGGPPRERSEIFTSQETIDIPALLNECNLGGIEDVQPDPTNVFAGVFTSSSMGKVGCLVRIELTGEVRLSEFNIW